MSPIPKGKRGRPRLYPEGEKAKVDVANRRLRRRAQAAAARQNNIRFQIYTAERVQVEPLIPHQGHFQSLNSINVLAEAATSQVITSQLGKFPNETRSPTLYDSELGSSNRATLPPLEACSTTREYEPVYCPLNPSQPTSPGYQYIIEPVPENDTNCFDNGDDIFSPSDPSPTHNFTLDGDSNGDQAIEQPASLVNADVEDASDEITGAGEGIQSRPQQDGNTSGQEDGDQEADSDFEFVADDVETDSDSEPDLSHEDETVGIEVILYDTIQSDSSVAKEFLENTWSRLCDCVNEETPPKSGVERVFNLKQMAEYWQSLGVPDAIDSTVLPSEAGEEERHVDWFSILSGGEQRPHLCLEMSQENAPSIKRTWDVDSIICWASCLSIIRGLHLSYFPLPTRNLGTNVHVSHQGKALNLIPHLRLGSGRQSPEFDVFVFFPGVSHACRTTSYLTKDEHRLWVDRLLLPAIREVCPQDVIQYQPRSFDDAESKTYSRRRENISGKARNNMDMHHYLPPEYLEEIWRHICRSAQQSDLVKFQGLFIVLSAKNIKLQARSPNFQECRTNIIDHLRRVLDWSKADLSNTWIDVGIEDTAASRNSTFLMKSCCLKPWVDSMKYSNQSPLVAAEHFNWNLTGQAGSAGVETRKSNPLRKGGIVYAQRYNVNKDIFSTASKRDHGLFGEPSLEGMTCPPSLLDAWIVAARQYRNAGLATTSKSSKQLRRLRKVFEAMKYRIRRALDSALRTSFSAREEYRIS